MRSQQPSVRLTLSLAAMGVVFLLIGGAAVADTPPPPTAEYVVETGDTLWAIASGVGDADGDTRTLIEMIKDLNGLETSTIHPGQILQIPQG